MRTELKPMLIGSRAFDYYTTIGKAKQGSDWDFICEELLFDKLRKENPEKKLERHALGHLNNEELYFLYQDIAPPVTTYNFGEILIAPPALLYILKRSHAWRVRSFDKTMHYLHFHKLYYSDDSFEGMEYLADFYHKDKLETWEVEVLNRRTKLTMEAYPQRTPSLNKSVEEFFDDPVKKIFVHDWLHSLYAYEDKPMFTRLQPDSTQAWCAKDLWQQLSATQRTQCVAEEAYVIATERFLVPNNWNYPAKRAYFNSVRKICTTLCSGWFRDWAIDHYKEVLDLFDIEGKIGGVHSKIREAELEGTAQYYNNTTKGE